MLAFSIDYYGVLFRATQSVGLFCTYESSKIIELVQEDIENAKKLILREPLGSAFKYKED